MPKRKPLIFFALMAAMVALFAANTVMAQPPACPDPYPPQSITLGNNNAYDMEPYYGADGDRPFPYCITEEDKPYNCTEYPCCVYEYLIEGNIAKISHSLFAIQWLCYQELIKMVGPISAVDTGSFTGAAQPCDGDPSTKWLDGECKDYVVTINPQPIATSKRKATAWFAVNSASKGAISVALDTGAGLKAGNSLILGPGPEIPEILLYDEVEDVVFGDFRFCLLRENALDPCPTKVYAGNASEPCSEIIVPGEEIVGFPVSEVLQSTEATPEPAVFIGGTGGAGGTAGACTLTYLQTGTGTCRMVCTSRNRCYKACN